MVKVLVVTLAILLLLGTGLVCEIGHVRTRRLDVLLAVQLYRLEELDLVQREYPGVTTSRDPVVQAQVKQEIRERLQTLIGDGTREEKRDYLLDRFRTMLADIERQRAAGHLDAPTADAAIRESRSLIAELEAY